MKRFLPEKSPEGHELQDRSNQSVSVSMTLTIYTDGSTESNSYFCDKRISAICEHKDSCQSFLQSDGTVSTTSPEIVGLICTPQSTNKKKYAKSRQKDFEGLFKRGVLFISNKTEADGVRSFGYQFIDHVKHERASKAFEKSQLDVQGFNVRNCFLTHASTVQRAHQQFLLEIAVCNNSLKFIGRDVLQAYVQSETTLQRPVFGRLPKIF